MALRIDKPASLKRWNSFGLDACAQRMITLADPADVDEALRAIVDEPRALVLGGGSNLLLTGDFPGTVLRMALRGRQIMVRENGQALVEAAAGENWHEFVGWTLDQGLPGLENLSLIPGTVGASPIQNIGAYGVEMRSRFDSLSAVHRRSGERRRFDATDCRFGYRDSVFKHVEGADWLVLSVRFRLPEADSWEPTLGYGDLRHELLARIGSHGAPDAGRRARGEPVAVPNARGRSGARPSPRDVADSIIAIRRRKLPDPMQLGNAGSFFRNPVVDAAQGHELAARHPGLPRYPADNADRIKLSAGWLIDQCGWKGFRDGDAGIHAQHALVLVNHGSATGAQLLALAERIVDSVWRRFGVRLEPEPTIVR